MARRAVVLGGTGAVGSSLVRELLAAPAWSSVIVLVRRSTDMFGAAHGRQKLVMRFADLAQLESETVEALGVTPNDGEPTIAFCTLGIGQPRKVPREEFRAVDVGYSSGFARGCRAAGVSHFSLLSSVGANERSRTYYLHIKGEAEAGIRAAGFPRASFFRPSLLVTREIRYGLQDRVTQAVFPKISWALPSRFHEITVESVARAMRLDAEAAPGSNPVEVLEYPEMHRLLTA